MIRAGVGFTHSMNGFLRQGPEDGLCGCPPCPLLVLCRDPLSLGLLSSVACVCSWWVETWQEAYAAHRTPLESSPHLTLQFLRVQVLCQGALWVESTSQACLSAQPQMARLGWTSGAWRQRPFCALLGETEAQVGSKTFQNASESEPSSSLLA